MRDRDIRTVLHTWLAQEHAVTTDTLILDELGVCMGEARVDIAVVNTALHGYEIKSARDTLGRLPSQQAMFSRVFDRMTLVASSCHIGRASEVVPSWWTLIEVRAEADDTVLHVVRPGTCNPNIDPYSAAQLLWRDEALDLLRKYSLDKGYASKPRALLWRRLADQLGTDVLLMEIRTRIKLREEWRTA